MINPSKLAHGVAFLTPWVLVLFVSGCDHIDIKQQVIERYPTEVESCVCRHLNFGVDNERFQPYNTMVDTCNKTVKAGHPSLPEDIHSAPELESLRCTDDVKDWLVEKTEYAKQQSSNRSNLTELLQESETDEIPES